MSSTSRNNDEIEISVPCKPEYVRAVRRMVSDFAESARMPRRAVEEIEIAAGEAVTNVVRHAYLGSERVPRVLVRCAHRRNGLLVEVADRGRGFSPPPDSFVPEIDLDREGGFGILLIKCLMDTVNYVSGPDEGTRIKMTKSAHRVARSRSNARTTVGRV